MIGGTVSAGNGSTDPKPIRALGVIVQGLPAIPQSPSAGPDRPRCPPHRGHSFACDRSFAASEVIVALGRDWNGINEIEHAWRQESAGKAPFPAEIGGGAFRWPRRARKSEIGPQFVSIAVSPDAARPQGSCVRLEFCSDRSAATESRAVRFCSATISVNRVCDEDGGAEKSQKRCQL